MKGLFVQAKKAETGTKAFKFAFKFGGEESGSEAEVTTEATSKKKKPNKRKKRKGTSCGGPAENPLTAEETTEDLEGLRQEIGAMTISSGSNEANNSISEAASGGSAGTGLSKSQKKNMKRKAKKADVPDGSPPATLPADATITAATGAEEGSDTKTINEPKKSAAKDASTSLAKAAVPKLSQTSKGAGVTPNKGSNAKVVAAEKEDWELEIEKAIQVNAQLAAEQRKAAKASSASPSKKAGGGGSSSGAPHFLSAKDPELDDATKQRYRFGMGRNLVAIGPAKVRDPNWLPPPPGLTKQTTTSTTAATGSSSMSTAPGAHADSTGCPASRGMAGAFSKKGSAQRDAHTGEKTEHSEAGADGDEVSHSSPFSFSFNGL